MFGTLQSRFVQASCYKVFLYC